MPLECHNFCAACSGDAENCSECKPINGITLFNGKCVCLTQGGFFIKVS